MQTLEKTPIIVPEGYFLEGVIFTQAGRKKVADAFGTLSINEDVFDAEHEAYWTESHPVVEVDGEIVPLVHGIDYFFQFKAWQVWELERIAKGLNDAHEAMQEEMERLGW
jgi:hypothetical protein